MEKMRISSKNLRVMQIMSNDHERSSYSFCLNIAGENESFKDRRRNRRQEKNIIKNANLVNNMIGGFL